MAIKHVFYDLDGTLLPMDFEGFLRTYNVALMKRLEANGFDHKKIVDDVQRGMLCMIGNDGSTTNEEAFMNFFEAEHEADFDRLVELFMDFYMNDFKETKNVCGFNELAPKTVELVKSLGMKQYVTTNPLFPLIATRQRIEWAGLDLNDFEYVTTYENSCFTKPNVKYYEEVMRKFDIDPSECLMIGNNTDEDMVAGELGCKVFLVTDELINKSNKDINDYPHGDFNDLIEFIKNL